MVHLESCFRHSFQFEVSLRYIYRCLQYVKAARPHIMCFYSLSYSYTMEVLEIAQVEAYRAGEVVVEGPRRPCLLCDSLLDVIWFNSVLGNLKALQKRHLESLAEGPRFFEPGSLLWKIGDPVDFAYHNHRHHRCRHDIDWVGQWLLVL
jgi:hypothetical protein